MPPAKCSVLFYFCHMACPQTCLPVQSQAQAFFNSLITFLLGYTATLILCVQICPADCSVLFVFISLKDVAMMAMLSNLSSLSYAKWFSIKLGNSTHILVVHVFISK